MKLLAILVVYSYLGPVVCVLCDLPPISVIRNNLPNSYINRWCLMKKCTTFKCIAVGATVSGFRSFCLHHV